MKTEVLSLILNRPNVRTVEIADRLDMEPASVRPLIADEIKRGIIVEETIIAPNGHPVLSFRYAAAAPSAAVVSELPPQPFTARVLRALPPTERPIVERERPLSSRPAPPPPRAAADPLALALSPAHVAPEHSDEPLEIDVPVTRKEGVPLVAEIPAVFGATRTKPGSRVDKALACLRAAEGKAVHVADLAAAMGIKNPQHPVSYLKTELAKGTVVRKGKDWTLGTAAVELPAPVVKPRDVSLSKSERAVLAKLPAQEAAPTGPVFPRASPEALAAYVPGSKRCTMNCGPHRDDPRSAAERAVLCDDCELVEVAAAPVEPAQAAAELPAQEPDVAGACVAGVADDCECDDCKTVAALQSELALSLPVAPVEQAATFEVPTFLAIQAEAPKWTPEAARAKVEARELVELPAAQEVVVTSETIAALSGGLPNIKTPYMPSVAPGAPEIGRAGLYENGEFRKPADEVLTIAGIGMRGNLSEMVDFERAGSVEAANDVRAGQAFALMPEKFLAGVMSDGSLEIRTPGKPQLNLTPEQARELYLFMQRMGYAAWPTAA